MGSGIPAYAGDGGNTVESDYFNSTTWKIYRVVSMISAPLSGYHGYRRHQNGDHPILWALGWFALGGLFPIITPTVALAEGYAKALPAGRA